MNPEWFVFKLVLWKVAENIRTKSYIFHGNFVWNVVLIKRFLLPGSGSAFGSGSAWRLMWIQDWIWNRYLQRTRCVPKSNWIFGLVYGLPKKEEKNPPGKPSANFKVFLNIPNFWKLFFSSLLFTLINYLLNISFNLNEIFYLNGTLWLFQKVSVLKTHFRIGFQKMIFCCVFGENWRGKNKLSIFSQLKWLSNQSSSLNP